MVNKFVENPAISFPVLSILFSALTILVTIKLCNLFFQHSVAMLCSIFLIFNPLFWYYSEIGEIYTSESFVFTLLAYIGIKGILKEKPSLLYLLSFLLTFAGGLRQNAPLFMGFFYLFIISIGIKRKIIKPSKILIHTGFLFGGIFCWLIPLYFFAGIGFETITKLFSSQFIYLYGKAYSLIFGASKEGVWTNLNAFIRWFSFSLLFGGIFAIILSPFLLLKKEIHIFKIQEKNILIFPLLLWMVPSLLFFVFVFIAKPGHFLMILPCLYIFFAIITEYSILVISSKVSGLNPKIIRFLVCTGAIIAGSFTFINPSSFTYSLSDASYVKIRYEDILTEEMIRGIRDIKKTNGDVVVISRDSHFDFRRAMYYLPEIDLFWLIDSETTGMPMKGVEFCKSKWRKISCSFKGGFWTPQKHPEKIGLLLRDNIKKIIFLLNENSLFMKELTDKIKIKKYFLKPPFYLLYKDLLKGEKFTVREWTFIAQ